MKRFLILSLTAGILGLSGLTSSCEAGRWNRGYRKAQRQFKRDFRRNRRDLQRSFRRFDRRYDRRYRYVQPHYRSRYTPYSRYGYGYRGGVYLPGFSVQW